MDPMGYEILCMFCDNIAVIVVVQDSCFASVGFCWFTNGFMCPIKDSYTVDDIWQNSTCTFMFRNFNELNHFVLCLLVNREFAHIGYFYSLIVCAQYEK